MVKKYYTQLSAAVLLTMSAGASIVSAQGSPNPAHAHIGHVMTSWKDTPDAKGFLPTAIADAQVAMEQIERADLEGRINDFVLYGGYVLNALDPGAETDALLKTAYARLPANYVKIEVPGTGYGIKRASRAPCSTCSSRRNQSEKEKGRTKKEERKDQEYDCRAFVRPTA